jgi:hypothetical protein
VIERAYGVDTPPALARVSTITDAWRPFRMWATVLLHVEFPSEAQGPVRVMQQQGNR